MTASLRFQGALNVDLNEIQTNLVENFFFSSESFFDGRCPTQGSTTLLSPLPLLLQLARYPGFMHLSTVLPSVCVKDLLQHSLCHPHITRLATSPTVLTSSLQPALSRPTRWSSVTQELVSLISIDDQNNFTVLQYQHCQGSTWPA